MLKGSRWCAFSTLFCLWILGSWPWLMGGVFCGGLAVWRGGRRHGGAACLICFSSRVCLGGLG